MVQAVCVGGGALLCDAGSHLHLHVGGRLQACGQHVAQSLRQHHLHGIHVAVCEPCQDAQRILHGPRLLRAAEVAAGGAVVGCSCFFTRSTRRREAAAVACVLLLALLLTAASMVTQQVKAVARGHFTRWQAVPHPIICTRKGSTSGHLFSAGSASISSSASSLTVSQTWRRGVAAWRAECRHAPAAGAGMAGPGLEEGAMHCVHPAPPGCPLPPPF